ncbi:MAG: hypothetical protein OEN21_14730 [Myxococcales bacterium]|nr:hypothetical protein [Myxococcales bacterium]
MRICFLIASVMLLPGCSDFDCPGGQVRVDGVCRLAEMGLVIPDPKARRIQLACSDNLPPRPNAPGFSLLAWELSVSPSPIPSGTEFGFGLTAFAGFDEFFLNVAQHLVPGGVSRVNVLELQATVRVRRGAKDPEPIALTLDSQSIPWTCRYDNNGNAGHSGDFPSCSPGKLNPDDSNDDCTGLGGLAQPDNPCGQFQKIPTSTDCEPGGACDVQGNPFPGLELSPLELCETNGFCVVGPVEVELRGEKEGYVAADSGHVLFGWDDVSTGAELDETNGPNHGTWILPPAVFGEEVGPNGMRSKVGDVEIALECTMAISSWNPVVEGSRDQRSAPAPDHMLISFPIQEP